MAGLRGTPNSRRKAQVGPYASGESAEPHRRSGELTAPPAGPVADFWAELHRLVRACRVPQTEIASVLDLSGASVSELLNGRRRRVPEWEVVRRILALCAKRRGPGAAVPPGSTARPGRSTSTTPAWT
ncbi:helix-turn-helix domain-containing protein [Streptomyces sp. NPDC048710]|uniref:helix-turn-helix domain-containing protein n=1 Tax=Streptomyces sp. NPDC048710 TaxID=3365586 RepID=UPI0037107568